MNEHAEPHQASHLPLAVFLERIRKSFSHDLRSPLGTIVNYAAVLETYDGEKAENVRDLARRIRGNAQCAARMVQLLESAVKLASSHHPAPTDVLALARSIVIDAGGGGQVALLSSASAPLAEIDPEVLGFAWRAYVTLESEALGKPVDDATLNVLLAPELSLELCCGAGPSPAPPGQAVALASFLRHDGGSARIESSLGMKLAQDLITSHGGELLVWGRPGAGSGLRVRFPAG